MFPASIRYAEPISPNNFLFPNFFSLIFAYFINLLEVLFINSYPNLGLLLVRGITSVNELFSFVVFNNIISEICLLPPSKWK